MSNFRVDNKKKLTGNKKTFFVERRILLDFSECDVTSHPVSKRDFHEIINTLASFESVDKMTARNQHKLTQKGSGKNSDKITNLINRYNDVFSLDVYHRGGQNGKMRLLYSPDPNNQNIAYILDCFIDTH